MSILASRGQEKFNTPLEGYTEGQSVDRLEYITGQNVNGKKRALDIIQYGLTSLSTGNLVATGSNKRVIKKVAHGARQNDIIHFTSGQSIGVEIQILSTPDADTMILAANSEFAIAVGDSFDIKRYVTPLYLADGSLAASINPGGLATAANQALQLAQETAIVGLMTDVLSTNNASVTPLGAAGAYTGIADDILQYETQKILLITDQPGTLYLEYSPDNADWTSSQPYIIAPAVNGTKEGFFFQGMKEARYFRVRYVNGATPQLTFNLSVILDRRVGVGEVQAVEQQLVAHTDALVTKGVIWGKTTGGGGGYVEMKVAPSGAITADVSNSTGLTGTFTANAGTNLNTSALNLESTQAAMSAKLPATLGQKAMAASMAVTIASDQSPIQVLSNLLTSATNSSVATLLANATFTGTSIDTSGYASVSVIINSDVASAADGVKIEYSGDNTNWEEATLGTFTPGTGANTGQVFGGNLRARYLRILYTNGAVNQTVFRLSTTLRSTPMAGDVVDMEAVLGNNSHGIVTKGVITGKSTAGSGTFVDVKVNPSGSLIADVTSNGLNVATEATQVANGVLIGPVTETAPATDTASSGLNGRLQRIAQRLTSLIAQIPATLGQKTSANSLAVVIASDQSAVPISGSISANQGTITGTITNAQLTVGTAQVRATVAGTAPNAARKKLMLTPSPTNTGKIFIGAAGLTTANAMQIVGPDKFIFEFDASDYYLISDTAAQVVGIVEVV